VGIFFTDDYLLFKAGNQSFEAYKTASAKVANNVTAEEVRGETLGSVLLPSQISKRL
jgi:hypothetical protein